RLILRVELGLDPLPQLSRAAPVQRLQRLTQRGLIEPRGPLVELVAGQPVLSHKGGAYLGGAPAEVRGTRRVRGARRFPSSVRQDDVTANDVAFSPRGGQPYRGACAGFARPATRPSKGRASGRCRMGSAASAPCAGR